MQLSREEFTELVQQALDDVPDEFLEKLENVYITVEDYPSREDLQNTQAAPGRLLGIYHGVPLGQRSPFSSGLAMPDRITIFQRNLEKFAHSREEIVLQVRRTVLHEIAHHFGISDQRLRELGY